MAGSECQAGWINCDKANPDCEKACTFYSNQELCNGVDDNCDCNVDESKDSTHPNGIVTPSPTQVCGVSSAATGLCPDHHGDVHPGEVGVRGSRAGHCDGGNPASCAATTDICDGLDNNCNGNADEGFKPPVLNQNYLGQVCHSDDTATYKHGVCQQTGAYACNTAKTGTVCMKGTTNITNNPLQCGIGSGQSGMACDELCDGLDNDCDGFVDETYKAKGNNTTYFVKPVVTKIISGTNSVWMYSYEASRPNSALADPRDRQRLVA